MTNNSSLGDLSQGIRRGDPAPISTTVDDRILVRGFDLADDLIGRVSFTEMFLLDLNGAVPSPSHVRVVDAVLVTVMEHGVTPSSLVTRLVADAAPESVPGAIAAGLMASGSRYLGSAEQTAFMLQRVVREAESIGLRAAAQQEVHALLQAGRRVPGFGHNLHQLDPRVDRLREVASSEGSAGANLDALDEVGAALAALSDRRLSVNAAGVIGAMVCDLGYAPQQLRGFATVARCAGLFAHLVDEFERPIARSVWQGAHESFGRS